MDDSTLNLFEEYQRSLSETEMIDLTIEGMEELGNFTGKRPTQCFTMKMPFPLYLKLKQLSQTCQKLAPEDKKDFYTMTACITALTQHIGIPALEKVASQLKLAQKSEPAA